MALNCLRLLGAPTSTLKHTLLKAVKTKLQQYNLDEACAFKNLLLGLSARADFNVPKFLIHSSLVVHRSKALLPKNCCMAGQRSRCRLRRHLTTLRAQARSECQNHSILIRTDDYQSRVLWGAPSELEPLVSPP